MNIRKVIKTTGLNNYSFNLYTIIKIILETLKIILERGGKKKGKTFCLKYKYIIHFEYISPERWCYLKSRLHRKKKHIASHYLYVLMTYIIIISI